jgi:hypothetical protein
MLVKLQPLHLCMCMESTCCLDGAVPGGRAAGTASNMMPTMHSSIIAFNLLPRAPLAEQLYQPFAKSMPVAIRLMIWKACSLSFSGYRPCFIAVYVTA